MNSTMDSAASVLSLLGQREGRDGDGDGDGDGVDKESTGETRGR